MGEQATAVVDDRRVALGDRLDEVQTWLLALPAIVVAFGGWTHRWVTDDAFVNVRVVEMTLRGHLLSYNPDQRVEAGTSPLWVGVLSVLKVAFGWFLDIGWLAVVAGLALTVAAFVVGLVASTALARAGDAARAADPRSVLLMPAGLLVLAVLPPMWDFATSGLETGLTFAWLATCHLVVVRRRLAGGRRAAEDRRWPLVVLGLGPLIRPDLAVFTAAFLAADLALTDRSWRWRLRSVAIALAAPVAFQLFRMAWFASLVPNTALAKEASEANWAKGRAYFDNLTEPYVLAVPAVLLAVWGISWLIGARRVGGDRLAALVAAPLLAGVVHGTYIVRVGGDFMHGRLLLPALFGILLAVGVLPVPRRPPDWPTVLCAGGLVLWAAVCATELRVEDPSPPEWADIVDERAVWSGFAAVRHPVTVDDYRATTLWANGRKAREHAERGRDVLVRIDGEDVPLPEGSGVILEADTLGVASVAAGPDVRIYDRLGLANALVSRFLPNAEARIGHQKASEEHWLLARLALSDETLEAANQREREAAAAAKEPREPVLLVPDKDALAMARVAVACPAVRQVLEATEAPLTPARALANVRDSITLTTRRFVGDPFAAASCSPAR